MKIKREDKRRMKYLTRYCLFRAQCIQQQIGICKISQKRLRRGLDGGDLVKYWTFYCFPVYSGENGGVGMVKGQRCQNCYLLESFKMRVYFVVNVSLMHDSF